MQTIEIHDRHLLTARPKPGKEVEVRHREAQLVITVTENTHITFADGRQTTIEPGDTLVFRFVGTSMEITRAGE